MRSGIIEIYLAADSLGEILSKRGLLGSISLGRVADERRHLFGRLGQTKTSNFLRRRSVLEN